MPDVVRAGNAAILATLIALEPHPPIARSVVRVIRPTQADLFSVPACERKLVLSIVVQSVMRGRTRPHPVTILREKLDYNSVASFVGYLERRHPCVSRPDLGANNQ